MPPSHSHRGRPVPPSPGAAVCALKQIYQSCDSFELDGTKPKRDENVEQTRDGDGPGDATQLKPSLD